MSDVGQIMRARRNKIPAPVPMWISLEIRPRSIGQRLCGNQLSQRVIRTSRQKVVQHDDVLSHGRSFNGSHHRARPLPGQWMPAQRIKDQTSGGLRRVAEAANVNAGKSAIAIVVDTEVAQGGIIRAGTVGYPPCALVRIIVFE